MLFVDILFTASEACLLAKFEKFLYSLCLFAPEDLFVFLFSSGKMQTRFTIFAVQR